MRKKFYEEPEMEVNIFSSTSKVRTVNDGLDVSESPDSDGDFEGNDDLWGGIY